MRDQLLQAQASACIICLYRDPIDTGRELGQILAVGDEWFLMRIIDDAIRYEGFGLMRVQDVSQIDQPHRFADFVQRALELREAQAPAAPAVQLDTTKSALHSACQAARLVSIHWEGINPDECAVGRLESEDGDEFCFREVSPSARWNRDSAVYEYSELTRIDLLRGYEEALAEVLDSRGDLQTT